MKIRICTTHGLSLLEVFIIVAAIGLLIVFLLPMLASRSRVPAARVRCVSNLKQVGLGFRIYADDQEDQFPWMVSTNFNPTNTSGSRELTNSPEVFRHFQAASNELASPKILICPKDDQRNNAPDFANFSNRNASYFVNLDVAPSQPQTLLSGDRNIIGGKMVSPNLMLAPIGGPLSWTESMHVRQGNVGLADGSVQQLISQKVNQQVAALTNAVMRLAIP